ncbi:hypothetical protein KI387_034688, partial [Taxus chinensis]
RAHFNMFKLLFSCVFLVFLFCHWSLAAPIKNGLLLNGNFEYAPKASALNGTEIIGSMSLPFWRIRGFVEYISSGQKQGDMLLVVPQGGHAARLGNEAQLIQRVE